MTTALAIRTEALPDRAAPADQHPAAVYLARLSEGSRAARCGAGRVDAAGLAGP